MKMRWILAALAFQLAVLVLMALPREWAVRFGRVIYLRTAPVDPRDVMRGDYVRLSYDLSSIPRNRCRDGLAPGQSVRSPRDRKVYALLKPGREDIAELDYLTDRRPLDGLYLRGRLQHIDDREAAVRYGLEGYFMEQGRALDLEQSQRRVGLQAPLEMAVALGAGGLGVLKGHRSGPLEIGLELEPSQRAQDRFRTLERERLRAATIRLRNAGTTNLALVTLAGDRSFALVPDQRWGRHEWRWRYENEPQPAPTATNVVVLKPGELFETRIDLLDPRWFVVWNVTNAIALPRSVGEITNDWAARFRFEYRPPSAEGCAALPGADAVWHGRLLTRAFGSGGQID